MFLGEESQPTHEAQPENTEKNVEVNTEAPDVFEEAQEVEFEEVIEGNQDPDEEQPKPKKKRGSKE